MCDSWSFSLFKKVKYSTRIHLALNDLKVDVLSNKPSPYFNIKVE